MVTERPEPGGDGPAIIQPDLFGAITTAAGAPAGASPEGAWDPEATRGALDELFDLARRYRTSKAYHTLLMFVAGFRFYSAFNAVLAHIQMPGARFVATPKRWARTYGRRIRAEARPIVLLQPKGPVMFVYDVSDTEPLPGARPLPPKVERPFEVRGGRVREELRRTIENAQRDGVRVAGRPAGSQDAGLIQTTQPGRFLEVSTGARPDARSVRVPLRYEVLLNASLSDEAQYATLVHELAHLYCGHVGTPDERWWPDRRRLSDAACEFEAESVSYLVCRRLGIDSPAEEYLSAYVAQHDEVPDISLDAVIRACTLIERMGRERMKLRKETR